MILLILCCGLGWFVAIPRVRDDIRDELADNLATNVAAQVQAQVPQGQQIEPGEYRISVADIEDQIAQNFDQASVDSLVISAQNGELTLRVESNGQGFTYSGAPVAENGRLVMRSMHADSDVASFFLPADKLGEAIENGVNQYFATQNLSISDIQLTGDEIIVQASPAS